MENDNDLKEILNKRIQETIVEEGQSEQDFFSDNNAIQKKENETSTSETLQYYKKKGKKFSNAYFL